jgi:hypothetical protein
LTLVNTISRSRVTRLTMSRPAFFTSVRASRVSARLQEQRQQSPLPCRTADTRSTKRDRSEVVLATSTGGIVWLLVGAMLGAIYSGL